VTGEPVRRANRWTSALSRSLRPWSPTKPAKLASSYPGANIGTLVNNYASYDWAGRVLAHSQITNNITYPMLYAYDLAGELTSFTFPSLRVQTNTYDSGRRETLVTGSYQIDGHYLRDIERERRGSGSLWLFPQRRGAVYGLGAE